ncbi:hypothetical protein HDU67_001048, partial [Dinochytrium kinnereticum]
KWRVNDLRKSQFFTKNKIQGIRGGECCSDAGTVPNLKDLLDFVNDYRICYLNAEYPAIIFEQFKQNGEDIENITRALQRNGAEFARSLQNRNS